MRIIPFGAALFLAAATASAQDFDKSKHPWARHKVGTSSKHTITMDMGQMGNFSGSVTQTLKEVTEKGFTTSSRHEMNMMGQQQVQNQETSEDFPVKEGEETLKVEGKEHPCVIWKAKGKKNDQDTEKRFWITKDGTKLLKFSETRTGEKVEATAVKLSEQVEAAGKKYDCVKLEGEMATPQGPSKIQMWANWDIPGGMVKAAIEMKSGEITTKATFLLTEIKIAE